MKAGKSEKKEQMRCLQKNVENGTHSRFFKHAWTVVLLCIVIISGFGGYKLSRKWSKAAEYLWDMQSVRGKTEFSIGSPVDLVALAEEEETVYSLLKTWMAQILESRSQNRQSKNNNNHPVDKHNDCNSLSCGEYLDIVQKYIEDFQDSTGRLSVTGGEQQIDGNRPQLVSENPLTVYRMIRRFVKYLHPLTFEFQIPLKVYHDTMKNIYQKLSLPSVSELEDAAVRLFRIQQVYDLKTADLENGQIGKFSTNIHFSSDQCIELGMTALNKSYFTFSIEWLEAGSRQLKEQHPSPQLLGSIQDLLDKAVQEHNDTWNASVNYQTQYHFTEKLQPISAQDLLHQNSDSTPRVTVRSQLVEMTRGKIDSDYSVTSYWAFCSGENYQTEEEKARLYCWLESDIDLTWKIRPLKMELASIAPDIVKIYDFVGDQMIDKIKMKAMTGPGLHQSNVSDNSESTKANRVAKTVRSAIRTSTQAWLKDLDDKELMPLSNKIQRATGMKTTAWAQVEQLQVLSYAYGGHYALHRDALLEEYKYGVNGDRIASFMLYFSDVPLGGYTAFSRAGFGVEPIKGMAVLWYNLYTEGIADGVSVHGGCPVGIGHKWAATKWIRYRAQFLTRPCALKENQLQQLVQYKTFKLKLEQSKSKVEPSG